MTFLEQLRARLDERIAKRAEARTALDTVLETATAEARDLNTAETAQFTELRDQLAVFDLTDPEADGFDNSIASLEGRIAELEGIEARGREVAEKTPATSVQVRSEERTYRQGGPDSFLADLYAHQIGRTDQRAGERLTRHTTELVTELRDSTSAEYRDILISAAAGYVPPRWMLDAAAPLARAGRPFLNTLTGRDLPPEGITFNLPRTSTGTQAAMTAEATGWNEQDYAASDLSSKVELITAQQDISRTTFMRGGTFADTVLFPDMVADAEVVLNASALNGDGTSPNHRGLLNVAGFNAVTYTDATPTVGEVWPKISDSSQRINTLRHRPVQVYLMHPRRWGWITSARDDNGRPMFEFSTMAPNSVIGLGSAAEVGQVVGTLQGVPVVTDAGVPTNLGGGTDQDVIVGYRPADILYWEDALMQFTFEQVIGPEKVRLAVGRFSMFQGQRYPAGISQIAGTGLATPAF